MMEQAESAPSRLPTLLFDEDIPRRVSIEVASPHHAVTHHELVCAWGRTLAGLTGEDAPVFFVNGKSVQWSTEGLHDANTLSLGEQHGHVPRYSGILTIPPSDLPTSAESDQQTQSGGDPQDTRAERFGLLLTYDLASRCGTLLSNGFSTASFLAELWSQMQSSLSSLPLQPRLAILNEDYSIIPGVDLLHDLVTHTGDGAGDHTALDFLHQDGSRTTLSYQRLHQLSDQLAATVSQALNHQSLAGTRSPIVPILLPRCPDFYVTWLAVLKAGAAVCPLAIDTPSERLSFILQDVSATVMVTQSSHVDRVRTTGRQMHYILTDDVQNPVKPRIRQQARLSGESLAYVMYTSGSTGLPKGVLISHRAATQAMLAHDRHIPQFRRFLQFASPTFDVSVFEIFFPWYRQATLVGCNWSRLLSNLPAVLAEMQVDAAEFTPTVAGELIGTRSRVPSLQVMLTIGEMLTRHIIDEFGSSPDRKGILYGMYGPTEATIHCTVAEEMVSGSLVGDIGQPLDTVTALIVSASKAGRTEVTPLPIGHIGELAIAGPQLADGYLNRDTDQRAVFRSWPGHGPIYLTGDRARIHPNGVLECLGRLSSTQIKLRGQRIELGEIEQTISRHPGVKTVVVCAIDGTLVAFITTDRGALQASDIAASCKAWLPRYMLPADYIFLETLPRLPSGKVDRHRLVAQYAESRSAEGAGGQSSQDLSVRILQACVEQVLGSPTPIHDSLPSAGLDSLRAIKLSSLLRQKGLHLSVSQILDADNITGLTECLATEPPPSIELNHGLDARFAAVRATVEKQLGIRHGACKGPEIIPCSPMQIAMLSETARNHRAYQNTIELEFAPGIAQSDAEDAFRAVAEANEILRSGFIATGSPEYAWIQVVWHELSMRHHDRSSAVSSESHLDLSHPFSVDFSCEEGRLRATCRVHHALYDGWSWEVFCGDLNRVLAGQPLPRRTRFRDIVAHLNHLAASEAGQAATTYWAHYLQGFQPCRWPDFSTKLQTPGAMDRRICRRRLSTPLSRVKKIAFDLHIGAQALVQSACAHILATYTGCSDVVLGSVSSGRALPLLGIEEVIGPCVVTVPLRVNLQTVSTIRDLVIAIGTSNRSALQHDFVPLQQIKRLAQVTADQLLFDVIFIWQETLRGGGVTQHDLVTVKRAADYVESTLLLEMELVDDAIHATATFDESKLPPQLAHTFLDQLSHVVSLVCDNLNSPLSLLNDMPSKLLSIDNHPHTGSPHHPWVTEAVRLAALHDPGRAAIEVFEDFSADAVSIRVVRVTYAELEQWSDVVAEVLSLRHDEGGVISICLDRCAELYVAVLSVLKAGLALVVIPPSTPPARAEYIFNACHCSTILASSSVGELSVRTASHIINVDEYRRVVSHNYLRSRSYNDSQPACIVWTSGSTGRPKGVVVTRGNLKSSLSILSRTLPTHSHDKMLQACALTFDMSLFEILFSFSNGMTLCAASNDVLLRDIEHSIRAMAVTHLCMPTALAAMVAPDKVPDVKVMLCAGEPLTPALVRRWGGRGLWQGYGPCETTMLVTLREVISDLDGPSHIGRALPTTSVFVASEAPDLTPLPRGAMGELCFGGENVAEGYVCPEVQHTGGFITHPEFGRVYRTGDLGRMLPDGSLMLVGRRDRQVKLHGVRIELGEIDSILMEQAGVLDCISILCSIQDGGPQRLVAFIQLSDDATRTLPARVQDLFATISSLLPPYMIPAVILPIDRFPLTSNGKKDCGSLSSLFMARHYDDFEQFSYQAGPDMESQEMSELETRIATAVAKTLGAPLETMRRHASLFSMGIDSISAVTLSKHLASGGAGNFTISEILHYSSVAQLARHCEDRAADTAFMASEESALLPPHILADVEASAVGDGLDVLDVLPCTPLQEIMLSRASETQSYQNTLLFEVFCDPVELRRAWEVVVAQHAILRTRFRRTLDAQIPYVQIVLKSSQIAWTTKTTESTEFACEVNHTPADVESLIPCRFTLICQRAKVLLHLRIHHAIYDAAAIALILHGVEAVLKGQNLPPSPPFSEFLRHMHKATSSDCLQWWVSRLQGLRPLHLQSSKPSDAESAYRTLACLLPVNTTEIDAACAQLATTRLSVLQACWAKMLAYFSGSLEVCFGNVFSGRNTGLHQADQIVGPCFNTLPVRVRIPDIASHAELAHRLRDANVDALPHQLASLRRITSQVRDDAMPLFDTLILLQSEALKLDDKIWIIREEAGDMGMSIICEFSPTADSSQLMMTLHFDTSLLSASDAQVIQHAFIRVLRHFLWYPAAQASDLTVLDGTSLSSSEIVVVVNSEQGSERKDLSAAMAEDYWDTTARALRRALCKLSHASTDSIALDTTIFQLGLDSINAVQLSSLLKAEGISLAATDIMEVSFVAPLDLSNC
ncbi:Nonribosomal Peptide Synthase (NRPS) [Ascosphaera acerosa]|nr:Nonribosomal Peptide Synthase (NRPS) [Ascosphaera acerosa]